MFVGFRKVITETIEKFIINNAKIMIPEMFNDYSSFADACAQKDLNILHDCFDGVYL